MRKLKLYIASSLNGYIADRNGGVEWLETIPNPDKIDYGYSEFYKSIDTTIQGYKTYQQILDWKIPFPYLGKKNYVLTTREELPESNDVTYLSEDQAAFIRSLKEEVGKDIWLIGGGQINSFCLQEKLLDEIEIFIMPIVIDRGIHLFPRLQKDVSLRLVETNSYSTGAVRCKYHVHYE